MVLYLLRDKWPRFMMPPPPNPRNIQTQLSIQSKKSTRALSLCHVVHFYASYEGDHHLEINTTTRNNATWLSVNTVWVACCRFTLIAEFQLWPWPCTSKSVFFFWRGWFIIIVIIFIYFFTTNEAMKIRLSGRRCVDCSLWLSRGVNLPPNKMSKVIKSIKSQTLPCGNSHIVGGGEHVTQEKWRNAVTPSVVFTIICTVSPTNCTLLTVLVFLNY